MNKNLLKSYIVRYDGTQEALSKAMGISLSRLNAKINETGGAEFTQGEILFIKNRYNLPPTEVTKFFFDPKVS